MWPTIVGMGVVIVGTVTWCVYLTVTLFDARDTAAAALEALISAGERLSGRLASLESPAYPKYLGTVTASPIASEDADGCEGIDPVWGEHDQRVREALTQAITPVHVAQNTFPKKSAITVDPETSDFFKDE